MKVKISVEETDSSKYNGNPVETRPAFNNEGENGKGNNFWHGMQVENVGVLRKMQLFFK